MSETNNSGTPKIDSAEKAAQLLSELRQDIDTRVKALEDRDRAVGEAFSEERFKEGIDGYFEGEEWLAEMRDADVLNRLGDIDVALQRLSKGGGLPEGADSAIRAEALKAYAEKIERSPQLRKIVENDPSLSADYMAALENFLIGGKDAMTRDAQQLAGRAQSYENRVIHDPKRIRDSGEAIPEILNTLSTDFNPGLGMRVPVPVATRIIRKAFEMSPILMDSGRATTTAKVYPYIADTGWEPEVRTRGEREDLIEDDDNDELFIEKEINVHEEDVTTRVTLVMLEDGIDVVGEYETRTARALGRKAASKIHNGNGVKMPTGLQVDTSVPHVLSGTVDSLPWRAFINAQVDIHPVWDVGASWYLSKGAMKSAVLATNAIGDYYWSPSGTDGTPSLFHGSTWKRDAWLDNETAVTDDGVTFATGATPALYGNVGEGCLYVERLGLSVLIDDLTKKGWRKYWSRRRWGWGVVNPAALRLLEVGT